MNYIPHTGEHISKMLAAIDCRTVDELVPEQVPRAARLDLGEPMSEMDVVSYIESLAAKNTQTKCFAGGGSYDHYIPSAIGHIVLRGGGNFSPHTPRIRQRQAKGCCRLYMNTNHTYACSPEWTSPTRHCMTEPRPWQKPYSWPTHTQKEEAFSWMWD